MKKPLFEQARSHVLMTAETLRGRKLDDLRTLVKNPVEERLQIAGIPIEVTTWAQEHGKERIAVVVEARRNRLFGFWSQVTAEGFYKDSPGTITKFEEKDYWEHGY